MSIVNSQWKGLYKIAGVAAIISELVILLGIITYLIYPYTPGKDTTESILLLLQTDPLGGLISLDIFLFIGNLFSVVLFLVLYVSLRQIDESVALVALVVGLIGAVLLVPARPILELFHLSNSYVTQVATIRKG
jgi:hypothetical protein